MTMFERITRAIKVDQELLTQWEAEQVCNLIPVIIAVIQERLEREAKNKTGSHE